MTSLAIAAHVLKAGRHVGYALDLTKISIGLLEIFLYHRGCPL
jgi:hypothetical protein